MSADSIKKVKFYFSHYKELMWLEDMAKQGYFLENITLGVIYKFYKSEPKRMLYEIDRFDLSKNPTLEEIQHKETFMDMAQEMGWKEVTHDESMIYYFTKEYVEGDINELYNDEESRRYRADKFRRFFENQALSLIKWIMFMAIMAGLYACIPLDEFNNVKKYMIGFEIFYTIFCTVEVSVLLKVGRNEEKELCMTKSQWLENNDTNTHKTVKKLILTNKSLTKFIEREQKNGWILQSVTACSYTFRKSNISNRVYTLDSKWLVNQRLKEKKMDKRYADSKDWIGINNDWQMQSVKDAEAKNWQFVCALQNNGIIYSGEAEKVEPLNDVKYNSRLRLAPILGEFGVVLVICGLIGGVIGFFMGYFGIW